MGGDSTRIRRMRSREGGPLGGSNMRASIKRALAQFGSRRPGQGMTLLTYHRVGGGSADELDLDATTFAAQVEALSRHDVVSLDAAAQMLDDDAVRAGAVVVTFDDGFADMYEHAWPRLAERRLPFTLYLATAYIGGDLRWEGSTAQSALGAALTWDQIGEMADSGLCTIGNHTHRHVVPTRLTPDELDACNDAIEQRLGVRPRHFAYPWGRVAPPAAEAEVRTRFRTAATGV